MCKIRMSQYFWDSEVVQAAVVTVIDYGASFQPDFG
jgi:hypothetical protein